MSLRGAGRDLHLRLLRRVEEPGEQHDEDAPSREPESIVNASSFVSVPAPNRLIAVAATGEPESTK